MFPLTHVFVAEQVLGQSNELQTIGAIFPDTALIFGLNWHHTHCLGEELFFFIKENQPELIPFALGALTHGANPKGLDYYGDECYGLKKEERGYCFQKALPIINEVQKACNLPAKFSWWKAHNFIEMAIEIKLANRSPWLKSQIEASIEKYGKDELLNTTLNNFYSRYFSDVAFDLSVLHHFITADQINSFSLSKLYSEQLWYKHQIEGVNKKEVERIIDFSATLVEGDFNSFLTTVIAKIKEMISEYK
ncbi:MAG TPA: hypothetical protein GXX38_03560 [Clostridia bacterium]|jgi:hypothetical protein|nr:hypothetical protein [Clostridia bacterium]